VTFIVTALEKKALRLIYGPMRKTLPIELRNIMAKQVCEQIATLKEYHSAKCVAFYFPINGELDLTHAWTMANSQGKTCYFPSIKPDQTLSFLPTTQATSWIKNRFGIMEPDVNQTLALSPQYLDIIFLPLVAFDSHGTRVGMGGGYYDRTLTYHRPSLLIGVAYEFQKQTFIQADSWDVPLDAIITQQAIYWSAP
jgi:5-formyltetrahydrofolate cyclo-ligase